MTAPKDGQYVSIQAFMVSEYGLKGNELIIYAVIYGYSQDGEHWYYGSKAHLAAWCGASKNTVGNCIKSLIEKGLVERRENEERGQVRVEYRATRNLTPHTKIGGAEIGTPHPKIGPIDKQEDIQAISKVDTQGENKGVSAREKAKSPKKTFTPPTVEEVKAYCDERHNSVDPEHFVDYYEARGWMLGKQRMKDWRAAVRTWERRSFNDGKKSAPSQAEIKKRFEGYGKKDVKHVDDSWDPFDKSKVPEFMPDGRPYIPF